MLRFTLPLLLIFSGLVGCNADQPRPQAPLANFVFSQEKLEALIQEREPIFSSIQLEYQHTHYDRLEYADVFVDTQKQIPYLLLALSSETGHSLTLAIKFDESQLLGCQIFSGPHRIDSFDCSNAQRQEQGDKSIFELHTNEKKQYLQLTFVTDWLEYSSAIGSTLFSPQEHGASIEILTSNYFEPLINNQWCTEECDNPANSTLGITSYQALKRLVDHYPKQKKVLIFDNFVGGSADDEINMYTGLLVRDHKLDTKVSRSGRVFSGATDLFAAGVNRTLEPKITGLSLERNQQIGVHSWSDSELDKDATDIPYNDEAHRSQATYFSQMLGKQGVPFYLFTLTSAPAQGAHWMSREEMQTYRLTTHIL
ncbi:hypothetical protein GNT65_09735 [Shewanella sp. JBTF-M18]|uniref:Uncharacterized protein n=1 Tax=Shewanella insulae TaxID=2681496 RepID=A0A6L7HX88_9GAMM|nr:hypothetical protein [Shewanella insulae]MXR68947.1 hypothetical protein [Shewanella insulae]